MCKEKLTDDEREEIFHKFWAIGNFDQQNAFVCVAINKSETKRHRERDDPNLSRRSFSRRYNLTTSRGVVTVCKAFFLATLNFSNGQSTSEANE